MVSTISGTAALQIALKVLGVKANDEVLLPSVAFVAAANFLYNFVQPHLLIRQRTFRSMSKNLSI